MQELLLKIKNHRNNMKHEIVQKLHKNFNDYAKKTDGGLEFWFARDLQILLGYDQWKNFQKVIEKAKIACQNAGMIVADHFADAGKMVLTRTPGRRDGHRPRVTGRLRKETAGLPRCRGKPAKFP